MELAAQTQIGKMTAEELTAAMAKAPAVLLPVASLEILGKHGPVALDLTVANAVSERIAEKAGCLTAPAIPYGDTLEFGELPGTVHIPANVLEEYLYAAAKSFLVRCGARAVVFLCTHSLNAIAAGAVCRRLTAEGHCAATVDWWGTVKRVSNGILEDTQDGGGHGSEMITSVAMALCPDAVHLERAVPEKSKPGLAAVNRWSGSPYRTYGNFAQYCESGAWGSMHLATEEKGKLLLSRGVDAVAEFLREAFGESTP